MCLTGWWQMGVLFICSGAWITYWFLNATRLSRFQFAGVLLDAVSKMVRANATVVTVAAFVLLVQVCDLITMRRRRYISMT